MRAKSNDASVWPAVARFFEASRHAGADLASAFERALPVTRRTTGRPRPDQAAHDRASVRRRSGS